MKPALIFRRDAWNGAGMSILSGHARVAGIAGWPVTYSRSPRLHGFWLQRHGIDGAYIPLPIRARRVRGRDARAAGGRICRRQCHHSAQARRLRHLRYGGRHRPPRRCGQHAGVPGGQDRRQQHRRLWLRRQSARPWRGPRGRAGTVARRRRLGACGRGGASGRRRVRDGGQPHPCPRRGTGPRSAWAARCGMGRPGLRHSPTMRWW